MAEFITEIAGVRAAEGRAAEAAFAVCAEYTDAALANHSLRSYFFGAAYAEARGIAFDRELFYVAALLHDLGLTPAFDSHTLPFEEAGGHVARVLTAGLGWDLARRDRAAELIVRHMRDDVTADEDAESHLLQVGTSIDVSATGLGDVDPDFTAALMRRVPRLGFGAEFTRLVCDQADRKPASAAAAWATGGGPKRVAANPLETY
ncbi:HD domain-containing protein [Yinghuangia seranimata]|uniref:HD domain-containing protein n=1 Tax=Yinghuangia seranimata TaxID=408067 RepID=UPI00248C9412|nr:HD domain-containing protein [Yinghuangia seranimata]MDI2125726.1 HD domain-containing protein [Yinghuangia seranimata]